MPWCLSERSGDPACGAEGMISLRLWLRPDKMAGRTAAKLFRAKQGRNSAGGFTLTDTRRFKRMDISRKLGILVFFAVPAIIGGGIIYASFGESLTPVFIYEVLLLLIAGTFFSR